MSFVPGKPLHHMKKNLFNKKKMYDIFRKSPAKRKNYEKENGFW